LALGLAPGGSALGGGGLPTSITDDFSADSGQWLDGNLVAAAMTVSGNRGLWTPASENAKSFNGDMETGDPPTGWGGSNCTIAANGDVHGGSQALLLTASGSTSAGARADVAGLVPGRFLDLRAWLKNINFTVFRLSLSQALTPFNSIVGDTGTTSYAQARLTEMVTQTTMRAVVGGFNAATQTALADDVTLAELAPSTVVRLRRVYYPSIVSAAIWRTAHRARGVVLYSSATDWIMAYIGSNSTGAAAVYLVKVANGLFTPIATANITYSAGAVLALVPNATFTAFSVTYGGAEVIASQAVVNWVGGTWYAGLANSDDPANLTTDAFGSFSAVAVAGASPF